MVSSNTYSSGKNKPASLTLEEKIKDFKSQRKPNQKVRKIITDANQKLRDNGLEKKAKSVGMTVPEFSLNGKSIKDLVINGPVILKFYRGHWCPYCMIELKSYEQIYGEIQKAGGQLIGLVPDTKKFISKTKKKHKLSFEIYQDQNHNIAKKFGLAFKLEKNVSELYKKFGINLKESQGNSNNELPMPGTYVINKQGKIVYAFYDADYTKRAEPREVLNALKASSR